MRNRRLHNKIAESQLTLPFCAVLALAMWCKPSAPWALSGNSLMSWLGSLALFFLMAYWVMETNNVNQLIRVRTRLMSAVWCLLASALPFMHQLDAPLVAASCSIVAYYLLFNCYQQNEPTGVFFHLTLFFSLGSLMEPLMLLLAVPCFFYMAVFMRSMSLRTFCTGIIGMLTPYLFWAIWSFLHDDMPTWQAHVTSMFDWPSLSLGIYKQLPLGMQVALGTMLFYSLVGLLHYWRTNYNDKIRTRMMLYVYVCQTILIHVLLLLRPDCYATLLALLFVTATPLLAHYIALTRTRFSIFVVFLSFVAYVALLYTNLWMQ